MKGLELNISELEQKLADKTQLQFSINRLKSEHWELQRQHSWLQEEIAKNSDIKTGLDVENIQLKQETLIINRENELLLEQKKQVETEVKDLKTFYSDLTKKCKTMIKTTKSQKAEIDAACLKKIENTNEKAEEIIKSAEARENQILSGVTAKKEAIQKEVEVLEAEKELLEVGMTPLLDQIQAEQDKLRAEREKAHKGEKTPSENFLQRLPDFEV